MILKGNLNDLTELCAKDTYLHQAGMHSNEVGHWGAEKELRFIVNIYLSIYIKW